MNNFRTQKKIISQAEKRFINGILPTVKPHTGINFTEKLLNGTNGRDVKGIMNAENE